MKEYLSNKINDLPASATLTMAAKAREMKNEGIDIIGLSLGEPDFNIPEYIKDAAIDAINDNYNSYTPVDGYLDLKESISNKFKRDNNLNYNANQIVVSTGAKQSIANAVQALVKPGEEVILLAPFWVSYSAIVLMAEGIPKIITSDISSDFKVDAEEIEKAISDKTKMIIINSPNNPSGSVFNFKELNIILKGDVDGSVEALTDSFQKLSPSWNTNCFDSSAISFIFSSNGLQKHVLNYKGK